MKHLSAFLLSVISSAALAQTPGALDSNPAPAQFTANEDNSSGGCVPIGLTVSGESVFPIHCKAFLERQRGPAAEQKSAAVEEKPAAVEEKPAVAEVKPATVEEKPAVAEEKPAAKQPEATQEAKRSEEAAPGESKSMRKAAETIPLPPRRDPRQHAAGSNDCSRFRSYDPASGTYKSYDGQMRSCHQPAGSASIEKTYLLSRSTG
ncbi:BA14K family protein, partial [Bradyrhizobium sp.]|uniref:BA14K family protein n=1 Tax=Bradyrhizobium sp. TaxID=376 RepID=UPI003C74B437